MSEITIRDEEVFVATEAAPISERLVIAPTAGRFIPLPPETVTSEGEWVESGQVLAHVYSNGAVAAEVVSPFSGWLMNMLALPGQPVHQSDALFSIWSA